MDGIVTPVRRRHKIGHLRKLRRLNSSFAVRRRENGRKTRHWRDGLINFLLYLR